MPYTIHKSHARSLPIAILATDETKRNIETIELTVSGLRETAERWDITQEDQDFLNLASDRLIDVASQLRSYLMLPRPPEPDAELEIEGCRVCGKPDCDVRHSPVGRQEVLSKLGGPVVAPQAYPARARD